MGSHKPPANPALKFDHCRTLGHSWTMTDAHGWEPPFGYPVVFVCTVCETRRMEAVSRATGEVLVRRYEHPVGYSMLREDRMPRAAWRVVYLDRRLPAGKPVQNGSK